MYLEIRYSSFVNQQVDGNHFFIESINVVKQQAEETYNIAPKAWRALTHNEAQLIDTRIQYKVWD